MQLVGLTHVGPRNHGQYGGQGQTNPFTTAKGDKKAAMRPFIKILWLLVLQVTFYRRTAKKWVNGIDTSLYRHVNVVTFVGNAVNWTSDFETWDAITALAVSRWPDTTQLDHAHSCDCSQLIKQSGGASPTFDLLNWSAKACRSLTDCRSTHSLSSFYRSPFMVPLPRSSCAISRTDQRQFCR